MKARQQALRGVTRSGVSPLPYRSCLRGFSLCFREAPLRLFGAFRAVVVLV